MEEVDIKKLANSIKSGANLVIKNKNELNRINVFPVADGDTGSNLAFLMQSIMDNLVSYHDTVHSLLTNVASAALLGARGNSGMILGQYLNALAEDYAQSDLSTEQLVFSFKTALVKVYDSLLDPKEGTILTVISSWSEKLVDTYKKTQSLEESLSQAQMIAEKAVLETQFQMTIFKENKLVDAGAKGFYYFITGLTEAFSQNLPQELIEETIPSSITNYPSNLISSDHIISEKPSYRYCSEFIMTQPSISDKKLKGKLLNKGDSVIVIGNKQQLKVHIHTNNPKDVLSLLNHYGRISYQKIDDMLLQYEVNTKPVSSIAIVTDSIADIPSDLLLKHQIHVIPMPVQSESNNYLDKLSIDSQLIFEKGINTSQCSTSQPTIQSIDNLLSFLQGKYDHVIVITVSSKLSGTYQLVNQRIQTKKLASQWITVIDSKANSVAQGLLVMKAAELVEKSLSFNDIITNLKDTIHRLFIYVAVADLSPMLQSGRIPLSLGKMAQNCHILPIVSLDSFGEGKLMTLSFSQKQSIKKIANKIKKLFRHHQIDRLAIAYVYSENQVELLKYYLKDYTDKIDYSVASSTSIAISAGKNSIAIAGILKKGES
ncbi:MULTISPECIES: DegV family protein [unclassified Vagococcus]|uniref:DegV family protein n=1 Tax=unclassified Vagococcus TaxID=2648499 RepID=UPI001F515593|nr:MULTISPECIES: DegV family protein [unclassified Vagococcus]MCI0130276.1 DegV family EDD domain-containing protein [Vagococcus sp. CY53-2]UNM89096.1 DegV family EDD domain-containing protein [Vagococcus sp. CY52-2]